MSVTECDKCAELQRQLGVLRRGLVALVGNRRRWEFAIAPEIIATITIEGEAPITPRALRQLASHILIFASSFEVDEQPLTASLSPDSTPPPGRPEAG